MLLLLLLLQVPTIHLDYTINVPNATLAGIALVLARKAWPWIKMCIAMVAQHRVLVADYCERHNIDRNAFEVRALADLENFGPLKAMKAGAGKR